ncbi:MAG: hypothetical protein EXR07_16315 [Acetobacteraceae bacterium]|nr:hypothetical protein [Acetobacteraceae bacterium]
MRTFLFLVVLAVGGAWYLKGNVSLMPDDHVRSTGLSLSNLGGAQVSGLIGMATSMLFGAGQNQSQAPGVNGPSGGGQQSVATGPARAPVAKPPALPAVTSATGTYITPPPGAAPANGVAKGGEFTIPPELLKFMTPSLLTTAPAGTQSLSPVAQQALQQIMAQARANPTAFKDQFGGVAKTLRGQ